MRTHGFELPFSIPQLLSWGIFAFDGAVFTIFCIPLLDDVIQMIICALWVLSLSVLVTSTLLTTKCDPVDPHVQRQGVARLGTDDESETQLPFCMLCNSCVLPMTKHCKGCDKCVHIFCHHEEWVNNCIGDANYCSFVTALVSAVLATGIIVGSCVSILVDFFASGVEHEHSQNRFIGAVPQTLSKCIVSVLLAVNVPVLLLGLYAILLYLFLASHCLTLYGYHTLTKQQRSSASEAVLRRDAIRAERAAAVTTRSQSIIPPKHELAETDDLISRRLMKTKWSQKSSTNEHQGSRINFQLCILLPGHFAALSMLHMIVITGFAAIGSTISLMALAAFLLQLLAAFADSVLCFKFSKVLEGLRFEQHETWTANIFECLMMVLAAPYMPLFAVGAYIADVVLLFYRALVHARHWPLRVESRYERDETNDLKLGHTVLNSTLDFAAKHGSVILARFIHWAVGAQPDTTCLQVAVENGQARMAQTLLSMNTNLQKDLAVEALPKVTHPNHRMDLFRELVLTGKGWFNDHANVCNHLNAMVNKDELQLTYLDLMHPVFQEIEASWQFDSNVRRKAVKLEDEVAAAHAPDLQSVLFSSYEPCHHEIIQDCLQHAASTGSPLPRVMGATSRKTLSGVRVWYLVGRASPSPVLSVVIWRPLSGSQFASSTYRGIEIMFVAESDVARGGHFAKDIFKFLEEYARRAHFKWFCTTEASFGQISGLLGNSHSFVPVVSAAEVSARRLYGPSIWLQSYAMPIPVTAFTLIDEMLRDPVDDFRQGLLDQVSDFSEGPLYAKLGPSMLLALKLREEAERGFRSL